MFAHTCSIVDMVGGGDLEGASFMSNEEILIQVAFFVFRMEKGIKTTDG